jgi:hypothetical protein
LAENRTLLDIQELRIKATNEAETTWQLRDGLLLRYRKLYIPNSIITDQIPLRTAIIRKAHEQPLLGHLGQTKLRQLI